MIRKVLWALPAICSAVLYQANSQETLPAQPGDLRVHRDNAISLQLGWNGLAGGIGVMYTRYIYDRMGAIDGGVGWGLTGAKFGMGYRHLLKPGRKTSPFIGLGINYATGISDMELESNSDSDKRSFIIDIKPTAFLNFNVGLDIHADWGFFFKPAVIYAIDLIEDDYELVNGWMDHNDRFATRILVNGGFGLSLNFGFLFK